MHLTTSTGSHLALRLGWNKIKKNVDNKQLEVCGDHAAVGALHHVLVCERELKNAVGTYGDSKDR